MPNGGHATFEDDVNAAVAKLGKLLQERFPLLQALLKVENRLRESAKDAESHNKEVLMKWATADFARFKQQIEGDQKERQDLLLKIKNFLLLPNSP